MKKKIAIAILLILVALIAAFLWTFTAAKLDFTPLVAEQLPIASPPEGMSLSALPTGTLENKAVFAFRGGSWGDTRQFSLTAFLIRHPRGNLLIDTGAGKNVDAHVAAMPTLMRKTTTYTKAVPAADQLAAGGIKPSDLAGVILTHAHWDHVSGLEDMRGVPVLVDAAEKGFIDEGTFKTELLSSFPGVNYKPYEFDGGAYLGFPASHDVFGDGSVVIVPAPGHTPGSVVVFVTLPSKARYAFLGDLVWQNEGYEIPAEKPWMLRRLIGEDDNQTRQNIGRIAAIHARFPEMILVPAHDVRASNIPSFPSEAK